MAQWDKNTKELDSISKKVEADRKKAEEEGKDFDPSNSKYDVDPFNGYIALCGISLEKAIGDRVDKKFTATNTLTDEYKTFLEDILDDQTIYRVIEICGSIKLNDPNLAEMLEAAAKEQSGQN